MEWKAEKKRVEDSFLGPQRDNGRRAVLEELRKIMADMLTDEDLKKFRKFQNSLSESFFEMDLEVSLILLAVACREHIIFLGGTGVNKTGSMIYVSNEIRRTCTSNPVQVFQTCLHPYTQVSEILGPFDIRKLMHANPQLVRIPRIQLAHFPVIDEFFCAISALLNTLLPIMNERRCFDPSLAYHDEETDFVPLVSLMAASNERQPGHRKELTAIVDRFALIHEVRSVLEPWLGSASGGERSKQTRVATDASGGRLDEGYDRKISGFLLKAWSIEYENALRTLAREKSRCKENAKSACSLYPYIMEPRGSRSILGILGKVYISLFDDHAWESLANYENEGSISRRIAHFLQAVPGIDVSPRRVVKIAKLMLCRRKLFSSDSPGLGTDFSVCRYMGKTDEEREVLARVVSNLENPPKGSRA